MAPDQQMQQGHQPNNGNDIAHQQNLITKIISDRTMIAFLMLSVLGLVLMLVTTIVPLFRDDPTSLLTQITQQIGIALFVTSVVSIVVTELIDKTRERLEDQVRTFLQKDVRDRLDAIQSDITKDIDGQTERLVGTSTSLQAMSKHHISQIYVRRENAIKDIEEDLYDQNISKIRLIGISLNDFVRDSGVFHDTWKVIAQYIRGDREPATPDRKLDIQILIVDPNCYGAYLRSKGELRDSIAVVQSRLAKDIDYTRDSLSELEQIVEGKEKKEKQARVSFAFHLYQLPPMQFLLWTDTASYIQPYYFWRSRDPATPMPLLRYDEASPIHEGMTAHFDWIWEKASVSSDDYFNQHRPGVDKGLHQSGVINVFDDPEEAKQRILSLMKKTKHRLYLQGFSLRSYFDGEGVLYRTIKELAEQNKKLAEQDKMDICVLLINPNSEQAKYRAFREYRLENSEAQITFEQFKADTYKGTQLYRDTERSVRWLRRIANADHTFRFKWYDTAPYCFILMVDDSVLVEQYHYGKVGPNVGSTPLGKDMARFEYAREPSDLYDTSRQVPTYELLESHFKFVFDECAQEISSTFAQDMPSASGTQA